MESEEWGECPLSPLPKGWSRHHDQEGRTFYANAAGDSTWAKPDKPLPQGWTSHQDPEGRTYFANAMTGEVTWNRPAPCENPAATMGTTLIATIFIIQICDMPELTHAIGEPHSRQLRRKAVDLHDAIREGDDDVHSFVGDMVFATIALPLVSPLVCEAIVAAFAAMAGLMEPGVLPGGRCIGPDKVLEVLEDNAALIDNLSPYLFSVLCRADAAAASGHSDASTQRSQAALSGACVWLLATICRAMGPMSFSAEILWEWANGDAMWVAVLAKGILTLDTLILAAPDTPLKGALIPTDLAQLQDLVAGAVFGLVGSTCAFADATAVLTTKDAVEEQWTPNVKFAKHWAKLAVAVVETDLLEPLLAAAEGPAGGRRPQLAHFLAKLLQPDLLTNDPQWIVTFPSAHLIVEAAREASAGIKGPLARHGSKLWAILATVPSTAGRTSRTFVKECTQLAYRTPVASAECLCLVQGCLADRSIVEMASTDPSGLTGLCVLAANAGIGPCAGPGDGGLSGVLQSLQPDVRQLVASRLGDWTGPVAHHGQACWLAFLQGVPQPINSPEDVSGAASAMPLGRQVSGVDHWQVLGMGGLKELLNSAPPELCCSLDRLLLTNPVRSPYGHAFEHSILASTLARNGHVCPVTGQPLNLDACQSDWDLKRKADHHIALWASKVPAKK